MFRDEPNEEYFSRAKKISDLKNLGPESEKILNKAGIKTAQQFLKLGWKKCYVKMVQVNPRNRHSVFAYALIGAEKNIEWSRISDKDKEQARALTAELKPEKKLVRKPTKKKLKSKATAN